MRCSWPSNTAVTYLSALYLSFLSLLYGACFTQILVDAGMGLQMNTTGSCSAIRCFWCSPPANTALDDAYKATALASMPWTRPKLVQHHYIAGRAFLSDWASQGTPVGEDIGFGQVIILRPQEGTLYWAAKQTVRTIFLPSDAAWDRIPSAEMEKLNSLADEVPQAAASSFPPDLTRVAWYKRQPDVPQLRQQGLRVGCGVVAQFVDKSINYPLGNAIIHVVDRVLAFAHEDLLSLAQTNAPEFYRACSGVPSCPEPAEQAMAPQLTLFAPPPILASLSNGTQLEQLLMLQLCARHSLQAEHERKYYVEGRLPNRGFVRAELTMFDQPAKERNFPQGDSRSRQPVQTVKDFINSHEDLSPSAVHGQQRIPTQPGRLADGLTPCSRPAMPPMAAFSGYKNSKEVSIGAVHLERQPACVTGRGDHRLVRHGPTSALAAGEYECTNGMVYPSSQVLFRDNDVEGYTRSAGPAAASSSWACCWRINRTGPTTTKAGKKCFEQTLPWAPLKARISD
uniref:FAS1 domain-containing protein n=1 Tax=Macrostomum lignano TaxID=282301 RepID=A0A1I8F8F4_9PLAT